MKAGSVGSSPAGVASEPLRNFLRQVGESVAHVNTLVVGLDAVENGYSKPDTLNISWSPSDTKAAALKARRFVLEAVLVRVQQAVSSYIIAISKLERFDEVRASWTGKTKIAQKVKDVGEFSLGSDSYRLAGCCLLLHWRNRLVHRTSNSRLGQSQRKILTDNETEIAASYAAISVTRLLKDFEDQKPSLKDVSTLISMSIRVARELDATLGDLSRSDMERMLTHYGLNEKICQLNNRPYNEERREKAVLSLLRSEAPSLETPYKKLFLK